MQFKNTEEEQSAIALLKEGTKTAFWELIKKSMEESKAFIKKQQDGEDIADLGPEAYKATNELLKAKIKLIDGLLNSPKNIISWLGKPATEREDYDPYDY